MTLNQRIRRLGFNNMLHAIPPNWLIIDREIEEHPWIWHERDELELRVQDSHFMTIIGRVIYLFIGLITDITLMEITGMCTGCLLPPEMVPLAPF